MAPTMGYPSPTCRLSLVFLLFPLVLGVSSSGFAEQKTAKTKEITSAELVKLGFFEDFAELDIEVLLGAAELQTSIASGVDTNIGSAPGPVTVITADEIQSLGARSLEDVLRTLPGFDIRLDSLGRRQVVVRGIAPTGVGSEGVLVLINGHRLNEDLTGGAMAVNLELPVGQLARIEVLRGPASALYGEGALTAVINLVSSSVSDFQGIGLEAGIGTLDEQRALFRVGNTAWGVSVSGAVHFLNSGGERFDIPADTQPKALSLTPGTAHNDRRNLESVYRISFRDFVFDLRIKNETSHGFIGYADSLGTQNELNSRQTMLGLGYRRALSPDTTVSATLRYADDEIHELLEVLPPGFEYVTPSGASSEFGGGVVFQALMNERRLGAEAAVDRKAGAHHLRVRTSFERSSTHGLEANGNFDFRTATTRDDMVPLPGVLPARSRSVFGLDAQDVWTASSRVTLTGGLRFDHGSDFGAVVSPHAALLAALPRDLGLRLVYGHGYRAPSFRELAFSFPGYDPNPDLTPVSADTVEAALTWKRKDLSLTGGVFASWVRHPIGVESWPTPFQAEKLVNLPDYDVQGIELEARRNLGVNDAVFLNMTHQTSAAADVGGSVPGVPENLATLGATFHVRERVILTPMVLLRGKRIRSARDPRDPAPAYGIVNLHARAPKVVRSLELRLSLENLFNRRYADPAPFGGVPGDYPRAGRSVFFGASYQF